MPEISEMKSYLYSKYKGRKWRKRVSEMSSEQIVAIYYSMKEKEFQKRLTLSKDERATQLNLF